MWANALVSIQLAMAIVFGWSALAKIRDLQGYIAGMRDYGVLPNWLLRPTGLVLVVAEGLISMSHMSGYLLRSTLVAETILLTLLLVMVGVILSRGVVVKCLCFGSTGTESVSLHTAARLVLLGVGCVLLLSAEVSGVEWRMPSQMKTPEVLQALASALLMVVASSWILRGTRIYELARACRSCARMPTNVRA